jgi:hypothetical protein
MIMIFFKKYWFVALAFLIAVIYVAATGDLYGVGGDDTRLYYLFPAEILTRFAGNIISNNTLGTVGSYTPVITIAPVTAVALFFKTVLPFVNTQSLMLGANLFLALVYFYLFLGLWYGSRDRSGSLIKFTASFVYATSPYFSQTLYDHQLLSVYLVWVVPAIFYHFLVAVRVKKLSHVVATALIYSLFSSTFLTLPWFLAALFVLMPLLIHELFRNPKRFLLYLGVLAILLILYNFYWVVHLVYPILTGSGSRIVSVVTGPELKKQNVDLITALSYLNDPANQLAHYLRSSWQDRFGMSAVRSLAVIYFAIITFAGTVIMVSKPGIKRWYLVSVTLLIFAFVLITPNFGGWNLSFFLFLNERIPLFTMFRNMYDKFSLGTSFAYAFALAASLSALTGIRKIRKIGIILLTATQVTAICLSLPVFKKTDSPDFSSRISGNFPGSFRELVKYASALPPESKFVWLPLNTPSYIVIKDPDNSGHFYYGSSPLQFLAGRSDLTGFQSFATPRNPDLNFRMIDYLRDRNYQAIGEILGSLNVSHVVVTHFPVPGWGGQHLNESGVIDLQVWDFYREIIGQKLADFGGDYSLYTVNPVYRSETVSLSGNYTGQSGKSGSAIYRKVASYRYEIELSNIADVNQLKLLEPYHRDWRISLSQPESIIPLDIKAEEAPDYGIIWRLDGLSDLVKQRNLSNEKINLVIEFWPQKLVLPAIAVSLAGLAISLIYLVFPKARGKAGRD